MKAGSNTNSSMVLNNLKVGYTKAGRSIAVSGPINAKVVENEMVGVIGRNGIGKSTLLRTLAGLQPPVNGEVVLNNVAVSRIGLKELARLVSFVSTEPVRGFQLRVDELIALGRFPHSGWLGRTDENDRRAISEAIKHTGVEHLLHKSINEISDGERQKVMITRALAQNTPYIILDEPTAFLDLPSRYEILEILHNLSVKNGKTILFSTHDLAIAVDLSDKIWMLTDDDMFQGAPEDLLINNVFRKLFLNSPAGFDGVTMQFRFHREQKRRFKVYGEKKLKALTVKALERTGFGVSELNPEFSIKVVSDEKPTWHLCHTPDDMIFYTIYDLTAYLKKYY